MVIIRKKFIRQIEFQGPEAWVNKSSAQQIEGILKCGPDQFVISTLISVEDVSTDLKIEQNCYRQTNEEILEKIKHGKNRRNRFIG